MVTNDNRTPATEPPAQAVTSAEIAKKLSAGHRFALRQMSDEKRCFDFTDVNIGALAYYKLITLIYDDISESSWYQINDLGREVFALLAATPQPEREGGKVATITLAQFVSEGYAERIAEGDCIVDYNHLDVTSVNKHHGDWYMVWGKWENEDGFLETGHLLAHMNDLLGVEWLSATPQQTATTAAEAGDLQSAAESLHDQYLTEKDRYQALYKEYIDLQSQVEDLEDQLQAARDESARLTAENIQIKDAFEKTLESIHQNLDAKLFAAGWVWDVQSGTWIPWKDKDTKAALSPAADAKSGER